MTHALDQKYWAICFQVPCCTNSIASNRRYNLYLTRVGDRRFDPRVKLPEICVCAYLKYRPRRSRVNCDIFH